MNPDGEMGRCYFNRLLDDWSRFDVNDRTKHDATVASSLALLAAQKHKKEKKVKILDISFIKKYNNRGIVSKRI